MRRHFLRGCIRQRTCHFLRLQLSGHVCIPTVFVLATTASCNLRTKYTLRLFRGQSWRTRLFWGNCHTHCIPDRLTNGRCTRVPTTSAILGREPDVNRSSNVSVEYSVIYDPLFLEDKDSTTATKSRPCFLSSSAQSPGGAGQCLYSVHKHMLRLCPTNVQDLITRGNAAMK